MVSARGTAHSARLLALHTGLLGSLLAMDFWVAVGYGTTGLPDAASEIGVGVWFAGAGLVIWRIRPRSGHGAWTLGLGYLVLVGNPHDFAPSAELPGYAFFTVVGAGLTMFQYAVSAHILLGYPTGRVHGRAARGVVAGAFALAAVGGPLLLVTRTVDHTTCVFWCYDSPIQLVADRGLYLALRRCSLVAWVVLATAVLALLALRVARSTARERRILGFALGAFAGTVAMFAGFEVATVVAGTGSVPETIFYYGHTWAAAAALVVPFFAGLLSERLAFAAVGDLVRRLERVPAHQIEAELGRTLRDRTLRLAFPVEAFPAAAFSTHRLPVDVLTTDVLTTDVLTADVLTTGAPDTEALTTGALPTDEGEEGLVDVAGERYTVPTDGSRAVTVMGSPPIAVMIHDPALVEHRELLHAAGAAARLALENARLHARIQHQLVEVKASRQRIAAAADTERRRLERDLHDGAQQRLLGIGFTLAVLRGQVGSPAGRQLLDELDNELRLAVRELRDLGQGIRPAVLTDAGLAVALAALARRAPVRATADVQVPERLDPMIEATAYYLVSEALQNVAKHAPGAQARIRAERVADRLVVEVGDDGPGGATPRSGGGLRGLADRVDTVGGHLIVISPPGEGTCLRAELPCG
ncbi:Histidine kinase [Parafrankia irregularis]|uniref:histidine kinase n=1 Tax=Parafrankia irregularis TaxID=795642 RepID=A0A0S4QDZ1_9ACTN|nr:MULTISPECIES: histidine kinase [Parafrankia]CUU53677.1 Histidine kinase [Parafrankia irregularis]